MRACRAADPSSSVSRLLCADSGELSPAALALLAIAPDAIVRAEARTPAIKSSPRRKAWSHPATCALGFPSNITESLWALLNAIIALRESARDRGTDVTVTCGQKDLHQASPDANPPADVTHGLGGWRNNVLQDFGDMASLQCQACARGVASRVLPPAASGTWKRAW